MSAAAIKVLIVVAYLLFVIISKAVKAAKANQGPGGMPIPQGAPIQPRRAAAPAPARVAPVLVQRPGRPRREGKPVSQLRQKPNPASRVPAKPHPLPQAVKDEEGPEHDAQHPVETHLQTLQGKEASQAAATVAAAPASVLAVLLGNRDEVRRAIIAREVLGPPLALR